MLPRARVRLAAANRKQTLSPPFSSPKPTTSSLTSPPASTPQIRFTRLGRIRKPFYRIIAIDSRKRRDGAPLEVRTPPRQNAGLARPPPISPRRARAAARRFPVTHAASLIRLAFAGAGLVRPHREAVQPERARHQGVAGQGGRSLRTPWGSFSRRASSSSKRQNSGVWRGGGVGEPSEATVALTCHSVLALVSSSDAAASAREVDEVRGCCTEVESLARACYIK